MLNSLYSALSVGWSGESSRHAGEAEQQHQQHAEPLLLHPNCQQSGSSQASGEASRGGAGLMQQQQDGGAYPSNAADDPDEVCLGLLRRESRWASEFCIVLRRMHTLPRQTSIIPGQRVCAV